MLHNTTPSNPFTPPDAHHHHHNAAMHSTSFRSYVSENADTKGTNSLNSVPAYYPDALSLAEHVHYYTLIS